MSRKLSKDRTWVGISSGAYTNWSNFTKQKKMEKPVVTIFADDNKKYLSTELRTKIYNMIIRIYIKPSKIYKCKENKLVKVSQKNLAGKCTFARNVDYFCSIVILW